MFPVKLIEQLARRIFDTYNKGVSAVFMHVLIYNRAHCRSDKMTEDKSIKRVDNMCEDTDFDPEVGSIDEKMSATRQCFYTD